jgi:hypothetical protein
MTDETKTATFQLCAECRQSYATTPGNQADAAEVFHGFLGPGVTMTRIDEPGDDQ